MTTANRLKSWLDAAKVSQAEMARRCGYDRSNFHRVLTGRLIPTLALATKIEQETKGAIPATDWIEASREIAA